MIVTDIFKLQHHSEHLPLSCNGPLPQRALRNAIESDTAVTLDS